VGVVAGPPAASIPLRDVAEQVEFLIKSREFVRRHGLPAPAEPAINQKHR